MFTSFKYPPCKEVGEGEIKDDAAELEGVGAVVMAVEHVPVLHPVVSEYHILDNLCVT